MNDFSIVVLLWVCAVVGAACAVAIIWMLTHPVTPDLRSLTLHSNARQQMRRLNSDPVVSRDYGKRHLTVAGSDPLARTGCELIEQTEHAPRAHAGTTPGRHSAPERRPGLLDLRHI